MKIKSKDNFLDFIQNDRAWRRQELTNMKAMIYQSRNSNNSILIRSAILLLYAHWEGYIKKVCESFFYYLNFKGHKYEELKPNFIALGIAEMFNGHFPQKKFTSYSKSVSFVLNVSKQKKFKIDVDSRVDTKSNLNTDVLLELLNMIGINADHFENNKHHIDNRLLKLRNAIAHGERTENNPELQINIEEFNDLNQRINALIDHFESLVINHLELESYKIHCSQCETPQYQGGSHK